VGVQPERPTPGRRARAHEPQLLRLAEVRIGRPNESDDVEPPGTAALKPFEPCPRRIVEGPLDVTGHHGGGPG
jgi:hypothetical protein